MPVPAAIEKPERHENMEFAHPPSSLRLTLSKLHWFTVATVTTLRSRTALQIENLALRLAVLGRSVKRPKAHVSPPVGVIMRTSGGAERSWRDWRFWLLIVKPEIVIGWHRKGFR